MQNVYSILLKENTGPNYSSLAVIKEHIKIQSYTTKIHHNMYYHITLAHRIPQYYINRFTYNVLFLYTMCSLLHIITLPPRVPSKLGFAWVPITITILRLPWSNS